MAEGNGATIFSAEQSEHFIESLHAVAAADGEVSPEELEEIRAIAAELGFPAEVAQSSA